jgi:hypothetical protein
VYNNTVKSRYNELQGTELFFRYNENSNKLFISPAFRAGDFYDFRYNGIFRCIGIRCNGNLLYYVYSNYTFIYNTNIMLQESKL